MRVTMPKRQSLHSNADVVAYSNMNADAAKSQCHSNPFFSIS